MESLKAFMKDINEASMKALGRIYERKIGKKA